MGPHDITPVELQRWYDQASAPVEQVHTPSLPLPESLTVAHMTPDQVERLDPSQLLHLLRQAYPALRRQDPLPPPVPVPPQVALRREYQLPSRFPPTDPASHRQDPLPSRVPLPPQVALRREDQSPSLVPSLRREDPLPSRVPLPPHVPLRTRPVVSPLPQSQAHLVRDSAATSAADAYLHQAGIQQNLGGRVSESLYPPRSQYPAPTPYALAPLTSNQNLLSLLQSTAQYVPVQRKAIQLTDFLPPIVTTEEDRLISTADGTIKMARPQQKIFQVSTWAAMAMISAIQFCELDSQRDPRIVNFQLSEYLFYLQNVFVKFQRFAFQQVLKFDREYRSYQLREKWKWGTHVPELFQLHLSGYHKPPLTTHTGKAKKQKLLTSAAKAAYKPRNCDVFNSGGRCSFSPCRYLHLCSVCNLSHPAVKCPSAAKSTNV